VSEVAGRDPSTVTSYISWQYSADLNKAISCETVWEISVHTGVYAQTRKILTVSLRQCDNNAEELLGEGFRFGVNDDVPDEC